MKKHILILALSSISFLIMAQPKVKIGMNMDEVKKTYPNATSTTYQNTITLSRPDTLYGLANEWGYRFEDGKLNWIFFQNYIDSLSQENFDKCFSATKSLIKDYIVYYGMPDNIIVGDTTFKDPYKQWHWGYDVIEAQWKNADGMKISIRFNFMGGKGEFHLIVTVNVFDKTYPYFN